ncbi:hypothetical protein NLI96_g1000 [Meripilus lineatus]|uniref:Uncharacterized protein n=1 Tax=Meripilus lineatus TaxID=2056292 RepID=A0AAD5VBC2_9APHY|nr:hypothetical protein NLI96_g1000 [Physisporinus lineatus]
MTTVPAPTIVFSREEWADTDFDLPDGDPIHAAFDKEDDEDWDLEMDLGKTGGAKLKINSESSTPIPQISTNVPRMFTIRPPIYSPSSTSSTATTTDDDDDEGVSTIKLAALPKPVSKPPPSATIDEDFEDGFALPEDLTQLSLRPLSLVHRSSKSSLEWGDKDQTSSSQSSDAYSSLGFADNSPSSNYTSASLPDTETEEEDEDEGDLDGLVIPSGIFESGHSARKLNKLLEAKKKTAFNDVRVKIASPDPEDDFEIGLVLDDDVELSSTRLLQNAQSKPKRVISPPIIRSKSVPPRPPTVTSTRPPSRLRADRAKSPSNPPVSSAAQLRRLNAPPSPPRSQSYNSVLSTIPSSSSAAVPTFLAPKPGSLRVQKSHSGLKPVSPTASRKLSRKASLPSLSDNSQAQASGSGLASGSGSSSHAARYDTPTASSRAKAHTNSTSRMHGLDYNVPPTRPSTPSSNPVALRLTMPTSSSRMKIRTAISSVFPGSATTSAPPPVPRATSPRPPTRPPSSSSLRVRHSQTQSLPLPQAVKVLKRPKRQKTYGDGNELDGIEDLPLDREKEARYRVQPKGHGNRVPGATYAPKGTERPSSESISSSGKGTLRRTKKRDLSGGTTGQSNAIVLLYRKSVSHLRSLVSDLAKAAPPTKTLKRAGRLEQTSSLSSVASSSSSITKSPSPDLVKKKKGVFAQAAAGLTRRKPTLIRNLGGAGAPKGSLALPLLSLSKISMFSPPVPDDLSAVVGEMKWNPQSQRWDGNDQALRDFDAAVGTSIRPALITHLTGSSIGSPCGSFAAGARKVGNMIFDPQRMCWISTLPPEEEEPDVFADLADDENDEDWDAKGGTIRASQQGTPTAGPTSSRMELPSPARSHSRGMSGSESDRGSRASMVCRVDDGFSGKCRAAEERHRHEMRGWVSSRVDVFGEPDRSYLYEIRALATRQY